MLIETWLVLDFAGRDLVVSGYSLSKYCQDDFDLRYILLPKSFEELLKLLERTISYQSSLHQEPNLSDNNSNNDYPPYIRFSYGFLKYLKKNYGEISDSLKEIEREYFAKRHPEMTENMNANKLHARR